MAVFTVHQPPLGKGRNAGESAPDLSRIVFVRDGFYVWGFLLSLLWMLRHRLWLVAVLFAALTVLLDVGLRFAGVGASARLFALAALCFLVGLEGGSLRRWTLGRRGFTPAGVVIADDSDEAERRFFHGMAATRAEPKQAAPAAPAAERPSAARIPYPAAGDVIGSFPQPERPR